MKITEIQIIPIKANKGLVAFASVVFDDCLYLGSIGVHKKIDGSSYRITYPNKVVGNRSVGIYHPINGDMGKLIEKAIIDKIEKMLGF